MAKVRHANPEINRSVTVRDGVEALLWGDPEYDKQQLHYKGIIFPTVLVERRCRRGLFSTTTTEGEFSHFDLSVVVKVGRNKSPTPKDIQMGKYYGTLLSLYDVDGPKNCAGKTLVIDHVAGQNEVSVERANMREDGWKLDRFSNLLISIHQAIKAPAYIKAA